MPENNQNNNQKAQYGVSTDEILDYLKDTVPTKDEIRIALNKQKLEILDHMDDKLANLKGEAKGIFQMEPFPQLMI